MKEHDIFTDFRFWYHLTIYFKLFKICTINVVDASEVNADRIFLTALFEKYNTLYYILLFYKRLKLIVNFIRLYSLLTNLGIFSVTYFLFDRILLFELNIFTDNQNYTNIIPLGKVACRRFWNKNSTFPHFLSLLFGAPTLVFHRDGSSQH